MLTFFSFHVFVLLIYNVRPPPEVTLCWQFTPSHTQLRPTRQNFAQNPGRTMAHFGQKHRMQIRTFWAKRVFIFAHAPPARTCPAHLTKPHQHHAPGPQAHPCTKKNRGPVPQSYATASCLKGSIFPDFSQVPRRSPNPPNPTWTKH